MLLLLLSACSSNPPCAYNVDCSCDCIPCIDAGTSSCNQYDNFPVGVDGHACIRDDNQSSCDAWGPTVKDQARQGCLDNCATKFNKDEYPQCSFKGTPGNPVETVTQSTCLIKP